MKAACHHDDFHPSHKPDGKTSLLVYCSKGGHSDPRSFYCTTYRTFFNIDNTMKNKNSEPILNKQFRWEGIGKTSVENQPKTTVTGYPKNLPPYFTYDKAIDEQDPQFRDDDHYNTTHQKDFYPPEHGLAEINSALVVNKRVIDGKSSKNDIPLNTGIHLEFIKNVSSFESTMKSSYKKQDMFPQLKKHNLRLTAKDHESGWVRDCSHSIIEPGNIPSEKESLRKKEPDVEETVSFVGNTGYNRMNALIPETDTSKPYAIPPIAFQQLKKSNPIEYTLLKPLNEATKLDTLPSSQKEDSGALRHLPKNHLLTNLQTRTWDTSYSFAYDPKRRVKEISLSSVNKASNRSGYSLCNRFGFEPLIHEPKEAATDHMQIAAREKYKASMNQHI
ncbi:hypothetical protein HMI54_015003 [Coelomomyces lativittatus]|nr:hypothetical protein HMI54_015003 [Coelomomyces lativittatus]KAJ1514109.1 hypothetical protein HMI56_001142 [Coelomomyces lativittatus]